MPPHPRNERTMPSLACLRASLFVCALLSSAATVAAQAPPAPTAPEPVAAAVPADYVIGPDDALRVVFWKDPDLTSDVVVRSDGRITLPLLNDVQASGLTPEQLRLRLEASAAKYITMPSVAVVVREIKSRKVFITGEVNGPGAFPLIGPVSVLQLIAMAGGTKEFADKTAIVILRKDRVLRFNYEEVKRGKNLEQNVQLEVGDSVIVP